MNKRGRIAVLLFLLLVTATPAYADAGVPMIFITLPMMVIGLIPIILIETFVLVKTLNITFKKSLQISSVMNCISTIIGIPITWGILTFMQMITGGGSSYGLQTPLQKFLAVTWQAPWLIPYESDLNWMIPAATLVLLIPFFFASYFIESLIAQRMLKQTDKVIRNNSVFMANLWSYLILLILAISWLIYAIVSGK